jgi:hypothetical protein
MSDPLQHGGSQPPPLFRPAGPAGHPASQSTSRLAGEAAALASGSRRAQILDLLEERALAIFEIAALIGVFDHQISGRFSALEADGYIRKTGERRRKPDTDCEAEVYELVRDRAAAAIDALAAAGYPPTLVIDGEPYDRQQLLKREGYPGIPYARRADAGGVRLVVRVVMIECEGCGRPLKLVMADDGKTKLFRCGTTSCNRTWHGATPREPGGNPLLALVMKTM